ncbi:MAG: nucleotidyltransferase domain-containing protein [Armatimonadetes bacterium]|nr:nucleotidyltransferase domain-containing protein [Armatimonadota bacterium]
MGKKPATSAWGERALKELLGSEVRARVISHICAHPDELIVAADLARELDAGATAVSRELARLCELGMLREAKPIGRARPYTLVEDFPLLPGLRSMCMYATGVVAALREAFAEEDGIEVAFIFGSLARGDDRPDSDVDVIVVGDIDGIELVRLTRPVSRESGREINVINYSPDEFAEKARSEGEFLPRVLADARILLKGDEDAIHKLAPMKPQDASLRGVIGMPSHDEAVADLKQKIIAYMKENWSYTLDQMEKGEDRFTVKRFQKRLGASPALLEDALGQLVSEEVLTTFDDVVGLCYQLAEHQPYG